MNQKLTTLFYLPDWNYISLNSEQVGSPHTWAYGYVLFCFVILMVFRCVPVLSSQVQYPWRSVLRAVTFAAFAVLIMVQLYCQQGFLISSVESYLGKSMEQKYTHIYGYSYSFSQFAKNLVAKDCQGRLITSFSLSSNLEPYVLRYFFYPKINIIDINDSPDCLVILNEENPDQYVPKDFRVLGRFNPESLIAVKK